MTKIRIKSTLLMSLIASLTVPATASEVSFEAVKKYAPRVFLHPNEYSMPMDASQYFKNAELRVKKEKNAPDSHSRKVLNAGNIASNLAKTKRLIAQRENQYWYFDIPSNRQPQIYRGGPVKDNKVSAPTYYRFRDVEEDSNLVDIQYVMFYPFNGCQMLRVNYRRTGFGINIGAERTRNAPICGFARHEGDWEHVTVRYNTKTKRPTGVFMSAHGKGHWEDYNYSMHLQHEGSHPVVYSAINSHAGYATQDTFIDEDITRHIREAGPTVGALLGVAGQGAPVTKVKIVDTTSTSGFIRPSYYPERDNYVRWNTDERLVALDKQPWANLNIGWGNYYNNGRQEDIAVPRMQDRADATIETVAQAALRFNLSAALTKRTRGFAPATPTFQRSFNSYSDHFQHTVSLGGYGGNEFSDADSLQGKVTKLKRIYLRGGQRLDKVHFVIEADYDERHLSHGEDNGNPKELHLRSGEFVKAAEIGTGIHHEDRFQVVYLRLITNFGRSIETGKQENASSIKILSAGKDKQFIGMHGRSGREIDRLGFITMPTH